MANMANITVKKADGTTDITYTAVVASAGDKSPSIWTQNTPAVAGFRPRVQMLTRDNQAKTARNVEVSYTGPYVETDSAGNMTTPAKFIGRTSLVVPTNVPAAAITDFVYQYCNLLASALIKQAASEGYAPT